ncbi:MAG: TIR domain-containing protein [Clostridia bacterium]|nr:TIR domain-containing protein [Clostridia bacterium]
MIIKCKMCGGDLHPQENGTTCTCEFCGSVQTIPKLDNERRMNLYDRGNHFRRQNEYDKAMGIFEQILQEDRTDAEAYWSLVLCRWGIEYVEDPATKKRLPTVNRVQLTSVLADEDYLSALQYADGFQKTIYEQEARAIDEIQKGILAISRNEQPFDVFICYKETDESGRRTPDSVLANELYHQLTNEGFKVFFSRITLEDKIGTAYEPYIFAALQSARVMVVLGTKPEYFKAVWVRNEWSRFLAMIRAGEKKTLVPAYRDMDPYDLPDEFSHLQAQDMGRLGFMQDLIRGIRKILGEEKPAAPVQQVVVQQAAAEGAGNVAALLDRAFMALEDGKFDRADEFCEQVLNQDARNAKAYLGKLMAALRVRKPQGLARLDKAFDQNEDYRKVLRFGDVELKKQMQGYHQAVAERIAKRQREDQERKEKERQNRLRDSFLQRLKTAQDPHDILRIKEETKGIQPIDLAEEIRKACDERHAAVLEHGYQKAQKLAQENKWQEAEREFRQLSNYKDSREMVIYCRENYCEMQYEKARGLMEKTFYKQAEDMFAVLADYRDSREMVIRCREKQQKIQQEAEDKAQKEKAAAQAKAKRKKTITAIVATVAALAVAGFLWMSKTVTVKRSYAEAEEQLAAGYTVSALKYYRRAGNYLDSMEKQRSILSQFAVKLDAGDDHTVGLKDSGSVVAAGSNEYGQRNVSMYDMVAVSAGGYHTVGLRADGTVEADGNNENGQCNVRRWTDIVAVSAGSFHTVGLKKDGTAVAVGADGDDWSARGQINVNTSAWQNLVAISAGGLHTVGLKKDGTVVAVGENEDGQCNVQGWKDIVAIAAGAAHTVGLKRDGTVVAVGDNRVGQCNVSGWKDIVAITCGDYYTVAIKANGNVVAIGANGDGQSGKASSMKDIVAIAAGNSHTVGLKADGSVVAVGSNWNNKCDVDDWDLLK